VAVAAAATPHQPLQAVREQQGKAITAAKANSRVLAVAAVAVRAQLALMQPATLQRAVTVAQERRLAFLDRLLLTRAVAVVAVTRLAAPAVLAVVVTVLAVTRLALPPQELQTEVVAVVVLAVLEQLIQVVMAALVS
jgi:hypothetical protein